jgi:hypothetical protein
MLRRSIIAHEACPVSQNRGQLGVFPKDPRDILSRITKTSRIQRNTTRMDAPRVRSSLVQLWRMSHQHPPN